MTEQQPSKNIQTNGFGTSISNKFDYVCDFVSFYKKSLIATAVVGLAVVLGINECIDVHNYIKDNTFTDTVTVVDKRAENFKMRVLDSDERVIIYGVNHSDELLDLDMRIKIDGQVVFTGHPYRNDVTSIKAIELKPLKLVNYASK
jgi:hypothetical protein